MINFRKILWENPAVALVIDPANGNIKDVNKAAVDFYGYSYEELCSSDLSRLMLLSREEIAKKIRIEEYQKIDFQNHYLKNNNIRFVQCMNSLLEYNGKMHFLKLIQDITDNERNKRFKNFIFEVNQLIITSKNTEAVFRGFCNAAIESGGFSLASVCTPNPTHHKIEPIIWAGEEEGYLANINFSTDSDEPFGKGPLGIAYNSKSYYYCNDIEHDPIMEPWRAEALNRGFRSSIAVPIIGEGQIISLFSIYNVYPNYFNEEEIKILVLLADNIAYAISKFTNEEQRKKIEQSERRIKTVIDDSTALIGIADGKRNIIFWNKALREVLGEKIHSQGSYRLEDIYEDEYLEERLKIENDFDKTGSWSGESELKGEKHPVPVYQVFKKHDIDGEVFFSLTSIDLAEIKNARQEIADYKEMIENSTAFISRSVPEGHFVYVNKSLRRYLEIGDHENISDYRASEFYQNDPRITSEIQQALQIENKWSGENVIVSKSGKITPVAQVVIGHRDRLGYYTGISTTSIDISAIKKSKQKIDNLFKILESSPSFILMTDINFYLIYANPAFKKVVGIKDDSDIEKINLLNIIDIEQERLRENIISSIYESGHWTGKTSFYNKKGKKTTIWMTVILTRDEQGYIDSISVTGIDISVQKEIEKQKFLNKLKSEFVSFASHEIRTPLAAIRSSAELISMILNKNEPIKSKLIERHLENIASEIDRLAVMVEEILTLEKIESGNIGLKKVPVDLTGLMKDTLASLNTTNRKIELTITGQAMPIETDPVLLGHILTNLLSNADKYSVGKPAPQVSLCYEKDKIEIEIRDFGIGIPEREQGYLFNSFFRASNTTGISGNGIGLTIVKSFLEILGGKISFKSEEGIGTQIFLSLPV